MDRFVWIDEDLPTAEERNPVTISTVYDRTLKEFNYYILTQVKLHCYRKNIAGLTFDDMMVESEQFSTIGNANTTKSDSTLEFIRMLREKAQGYRGTQ